MRKTKMCKICWSITGVLLVVIIGMGYKFIIQGDVAQLDDNRVAIQLTKSERDLVLTEMRIFLQSVQQITNGISKDELTLAADSARQSGSNAQIAVPGTHVNPVLVLR
jgi:uncharacterized protein YpmB